MTNEWKENEKDSEKIPDNTESEVCLDPSENSRAPPVVSQVLRINPNSLRHQKQRNPAKQWTSQSSLLSSWLRVIGWMCMPVLIACMFAFHALRTLYLMFLAFKPLLLGVSSISLHPHTHTHPSGIPYDGGHQDTPSLTSHIHHREVCRLPPPRPKSNSKTSPKDLPKWMPMHNLLIKTVTNNLLHHTIQIWWPMSIIKSELAQEHTKFWKAVSLDSRSHLVLCLVLIPRLQSSSLTVKKNDKDLHQRFYQTQNGSGAPPSVCSNMIWQAHPCPGKLGGHLGRKFQWPSRRLEQQCRTWEFRLTSKACQPALSFLSFILCSLQAVGVC